MRQRSKYTAQRRATSGRRQWCGIFKLFLRKVRQFLHDFCRERAARDGLGRIRAPTSV